MRNKIMGGIVAVAAAFAIATPALADATIRVDENHEAGWEFNRDPANTTHYEFSLDEASLGTGSLHVLPIGTNAADKFTGDLALGVNADDVESVSYDFQIEGPATAEEHFYLNVYAIHAGSSETFYNCRFDYVPTVGSNTAFTTASFAATATPVNVRDRQPLDGLPCPATLADFNGTVRAITINVGDTSANDAGLGGYLDHVVVDLTSGSTTYDFEVLPIVKDACKDGGYAAFGFANQGDCVSALQAAANANK